MSVNIEFDFSNIEEELNSIVKGMGEAEESIILQSAQLVRDTMKQKVNVSNISRPDYRHIRDDIRMSILKDDGMGTKFREIRGTKRTAFKWKFLEFGTVRMKPIPFMQPSLDETAIARENITNEELRKVIEK